MRSIEETVSFRIVLACRAHRNVMAQQLDTLSLYVGQELILGQLWKEEGLTQSCLAERVGIDVSRMTKALQRLERYGLVTRQGIVNLFVGTKAIAVLKRGKTLESNEGLEERSGYAACFTPVTSFQVWNRPCKRARYSFARK
jgi:hypothetical protein